MINLVMSTKAVAIRRKLTIAMVAGISIFGVVTHAQSQSNTKPTQLIVPYGTGTGTDALARLLSKVITVQTGQPVLVENKPGASAQIGAQAVARSAPDGKTLLLAGDHVMCFNPILFKTLPYHPKRDFTPVAGITIHPFVLAVPSSLNVKNVAELLALAKATPNGLSFASTGVATSAHLAGELFKSDSKINMTHIPYQSAAPLFSDLISGRVAMTFYPYQQLKPHIDSGSLRALAITTERRASWLPDVPSMPELGFRNTLLAAYLNIYGPAGLSTENTAQLSEMFRKAAESTEVAGTIAKDGVEVRYLKPTQLAEFDNKLDEACRHVVALSGAQPQ